MRTFGLLLAALEVPGIPETNTRPLEISNKDPLEIRPVTDAVWRKEFEPLSNMLPHANGEVLDDVVIIHSSSSTGKPEVLKPYTGVRLLGVLGDVAGWLEAI